MEVKEETNQQSLIFTASRLKHSRYVYLTCSRTVWLSCINISFNHICWLFCLKQKKILYTDVPVSKYNNAAIHQILLQTAIFRKSEKRWMQVLYRLWVWNPLLWLFKPDSYFLFGSKDTINILFNYDLSLLWSVVIHKHLCFFVFSFREIRSKKDVTQSTSSLTLLL